MKILNNIFTCVVYILLAASVLILITIHWELMGSTFDITPDGIYYYLEKYAKYQFLFTGTVAATGAHLGLMRLKVTDEANKDKLRQDRVMEWRSVLEGRFLDIEFTDPLMNRVFMKERLNLYS